MDASERESYKVNVLRESLYPLRDMGDEYEPLLEAVGDATLVLLGEATHGTHEFYRERAQITKQLIRKKGFMAVAIEGDWPDAHRVDQFVRGRGGADTEAVDALRGFTRFPSWMWANGDILDFVGWLHSHNETVANARSQIGFYGLDLYSLYSSMDEVIKYLKRVDPEAAERAKLRYGCLDRFDRDCLKYARAAGLGLSPSCEEEVVAQLFELLRRRAIYLGTARHELEEEAFFDAEQNSRLVQAAEHYYRTMLRAEVSSWNLRDQHMVETLEHLRSYLIRRGLEPKVVVWAHNSHVGDARATEMSTRGEINVGELTRQAFGTGGDGVVSVGFTTYGGTVTAASAWDAEPERKRVRPAIKGSYEELFHAVGQPRFFLDLRRSWEAVRVLRDPLLERAIGVLYLPETERASHYFGASLSMQFDAIIHIDRTRAVEPLEHTATWKGGTEPPETYPTGV